MSNYYEMDEDEIRKLFRLDTIEFVKKVGDDTYYLGRKCRNIIRIRYNPYKALMYKEEGDTIWKKFIL